MRKSILTLLCLALLSGMPHTARADGNAAQTSHSATLGEKLELGVFGGVLLMSPDHNVVHPDAVRYEYKRFSPELGLRAAYYPLRYLGLEAEGMLAPTRVHAGNESFALLYGLRAHLLLQLPFERVIPFVLAGGGLLGANSKPMGPDIDPAAHVGVGLKVRLSDRLLARVDLRGNIAHRADDSKHAATIHPELLLGLSMRLGSPPKAAHDTDHDGIPDANDACVTEPEDIDGFEDADGCPDLDNDRDGIADAADPCPLDAEDADGFEDADGCPELDNDRDGIPDASDRCPNEAGVTEEQGCPPPPPAAVEPPAPVEPPAVVVKADKIELNESVYFGVNNANIQPSSFALLDGLAKALGEHPEIELVVVEGHTDSQGRANLNLKLSKDRAAAVVQALVQRGIASERLQSEGFGPAKPVASNDSAEGRAQNRRVEVRILKRKGE